MVDYSKWDKFDYDDDDEDEFASPAQVTKIGGEKGGKVHIGPSGYSVEDESGDGVDHVQPRTVTTISSSVASKPSLSKTGGLGVIVENGSTGKYRNVDYCWSQDRYEVSLTLFIDWVEGMRKKDITVSYFSGTKELKIISKLSESNSFIGNFQFAVELVGDPENPYDDIFDWGIVSGLQHPTDHTRTYTAIQIALKKISPLPNSIFWWKNVFIGEPHIDVTKISGRTPAAEDEFQTAQRIFLERMQQLKKQPEQLDHRIPIDFENDSEQKEEGEGEDNDG